ncbi:MAG: class E sortase [Pseudoflavonifractor capillosus]|uniref:Sortase family protein n=1 Tax=Pseudoflavonifractor capillosus ATCC 29799 TaxID=411467 RepID=A6NR21_9FIRM|nr:class E sortase [Pseudoflavonifractor capillosus]EDN01517.1 sortase family protein [Pseudoflavonifractor capillosus ATCC 29799]MCI5928706.1 class E sortase [Pseudoflavonifractor capillosus]MDY4661607.1 class E sortase [Pseudoflavonifractor capillosus]
MKRHSKGAVIAAAAAVVLLIAAAALFIWGSQPQYEIEVPSTAPVTSFTPSPEPTPTDSETPSPTPTPLTYKEVLEEPEDGLPTDKVFVTDTRKNYQSGDLRLIIPKLDVDESILNGVDEQTLLQGEGLYDYAQLPGEGRSNTSIAGHRNWIRNGKITLDQPFSFLDTLVEGDYLYLVYGENIYQYLFEYQEVVEPDDWGPIYKTDHSCVTLTTCTPVGVSDHRLIVRGALVDIIPLSDDYAYPANAEEEASINS